MLKETMITKDLILGLVRQYIEDKTLADAQWSPGEDWISYSGPHFDADEYVAAVSSLLDGWFVLGKKGREFELEFAKFLGKKYGVLTNSGSSANLLMVSALRSQQDSKWNLPVGAKFITPVVCFPTTINPLIQNGFTPVFVDVTLPSLNLDLDQVEELLKGDPDIRGIIFAHVLGNPPDMDRLMGLVEEYDLIFLEDACDALGSYYKDKPLGSFGLMSTCSFFVAHHMSLCEGGFVATGEPRLRRVLASFRDWGRACYCNERKPGNVTSGTACGDRFKCWFPDQPDVIFDHRYVFSEVGYNLKPLEMQAAIGLEQIKKLGAMEEARRSNFKTLKNIFKEYEQYFYLPEATPNSDPCWFGFLLTVRENAPFTKQQLVDHLESCKIQTRSYFTGNALNHPAFSYLDKDQELDFPVADYITENTFFLGTYIGLTYQKLGYIEDAVNEFFERKEIL